MEEESYIEQEYPEQVLKKPAFPLVRILLAVVVLALLAVAVFYVLRYFRSDRYFFSRLQKLEEEITSENGGDFLEKAHSPAQALAILKRLDEANNQTGYQTALFSAMSKFKDLRIQALYVEFLLRAGNALPTAVLLDLEGLWKHYPALMRYYSLQFPDARKGTHERYDEVLSLYNKIRAGTLNLEDFHLLYSITGNELFRYLIYLRYTLRGNSDFAARVLSSIAVEWKEENQNYRELSRQNQHATSSLQDANYNKNEQFAMAIEFLLQGAIDSSMQVLNELVRTYPMEKLGTAIWEFYFWMKRNYAPENDRKFLNDEFQKIKKSLLSSVDLTMQYLLYLYQYRREEGLEWIENTDLNTMVEKDPRIQFVKTWFLKGTNSQREVYLWKKLEESGKMEDEAAFLHWLQFTVNHLSLGKNIEALNLLFSRYQDYSKILLPYRVYYLLVSGEIYSMPQNEMESTLDLFHSFDLPWWNQYNVAVWNIEQHNLEKAEEYLLKSERALSSFRNTNVHSAYIMQYIRISLLRNDPETAENYLKELKILNPTYPYLQELEKLIHYRKALLVEMQ